MHYIIALILITIYIMHNIDNKRFCQLISIYYNARKSIRLNWMKPFSSTSNCKVRQKQKTNKRYATMPLPQPLQDCRSHMGSTTMRSWHGKASRMLLHGSANRRSPHPFGSFSSVQKRKRIPSPRTRKIHPNDNGKLFVSL